MAESKKEKVKRESEERARASGVEDQEHIYEDWDDLSSNTEEASRLSRALEGLLPDILKRGVGGLVSEDGIRSILTDRGLPREAVGFLLTQIDATKREVVRMVSKEVRLFLENVDLGGELTKILTSVSFEIRTEVRFIPNDAAVKPNIRNRVSIRGTRDDDEEKADEEPLAEDESKERVRNKRRRWPLGRGRDDDSESISDEEEQSSPSSTS